MARGPKIHPLDRLESIQEVDDSVFPDVVSEFSDSQRTTTDTSTTWGPGTLSGRALLALGEATIRGIDALLIRRRLATIRIRAPSLADPMYKDLLELCRPAMYSPKGGPTVLRQGPLRGFFCRQITPLRGPHPAPDAVMNLVIVPNRAIYTCQLPPRSASDAVPGFLGCATPPPTVHFVRLVFERCSTCFPWPLSVDWDRVHLSTGCSLASAARMYALYPLFGSNLWHWYGILSRHLSSDIYFFFHLGTI